MTTSARLPSSRFRGRRSAASSRRLRDWLPALVVLVGTLAGWRASVVWFGIKQFLILKPTAIATPFTRSSKMAIAAVLCFFPVLVNALRGLTPVRPSSLEPMHSYAAGQIEIFRRVRIPTALCGCRARAPHIAPRARGGRLT